MFDFLFLDNDFIWFLLWIYISYDEWVNILIGFWGVCSYELEQMVVCLYMINGFSLLICACWTCFILWFKNVPFYLLISVHRFSLLYTLKLLSEHWWNIDMCDFAVQVMSYNYVQYQFVVLQSNWLFWFFSYGNRNCELKLLMDWCWMFVVDVKY